MKLVVVGAGGHASVVVDAAREAGVADITVVDERATISHVGSAPVASSLAQVQGATHFIVAIGDNAARAAEYERAIAAGLTPYSVIHPSAVISAESLIADGVFVGALAVVNPGAVIRTNAIVNTAAVVEHDCSVGKHAFIGPSATLCGGCSVGDSALVGAGATLIPLVSVGEGSVVGAGATVTENFGDGLTVAGVPARAIRGAGA